MKLPTLLTVSLSLVLAHGLHAQSLQGKEAPEFTMGGVVNRDGPVKLSEMAGDVVVIEVWGIT